MILWVLIAFAIICVLTSVIIVNQSQAVIIERLGKFSRVLRPGLNFIIPILEKPKGINWKVTTQGRDGNTFTYFKKRNKIDLRESVHGFSYPTIITKDNIILNMYLTIYIQIVNPINVVYNAPDLLGDIDNLMRTTLRGLVGQLDMQETLVSRDKINQNMRDILNEATNNWGVDIIRVELQDINPITDLQSTNKG